MARDYIERRESYEGLDGYKLGWITICHGRLHNGGVDVTPPLTGKCPHCGRAAQV